MSREVRRVPSGFDWPLDKTWEGYFMPEFLREKRCVMCGGSGYSPEGQRMHDEWWGYTEFNPEDNGSEPFDHHHPKIWAFAERNVTGAPQYYGTDPFAIDREAQRLAALWNGEWKSHLNQEEVDAQLARGVISDITHTWSREDGWVAIEPRPTPTAREYNEFYLTAAMDGPSEWVAMEVRAKREGVELKCSHCNGRGYAEKFKGQRKAAKKWKPVKPPKGDAWQIWETVSEGSPVTPAFDTPEELARYWVRGGGDYENALAWIVGPGWAPSGVISGGQIKTAEDIISDGGF